LSLTTLKSLSDLNGDTRGEESVVRVIDPRVAKALSHPLSVRVLAALNERVASPEELSQDLGESLSETAYHVDVLAAMGCIGLVETKQRGGAVEHFFRAVKHTDTDIDWEYSDTDWGSLPPEVQQAISVAVLKMIVGDATEAMALSTFDARRESHLSRLSMVLDQAGWKEAADLLAATLDRLLEIQAGASQRLIENPGAGIPTKAGIMLFESPAIDMSGEPSSNGHQQQSRNGHSH
jgi:DNA-binding transcriptional ArsR family regulator